VLGCSAISPLMNGSNASSRGAAHQRPGDAIVDGKQIAQRPAIVGFLLDAAGIEPDAAGVDREIAAVQAQRARDHVAGADQLSDPDHARLGQRRVRRQIEIAERPHPFIA
jgi:hypothetical protein